MKARISIFIFCVTSLLLQAIRAYAEVESDSLILKRVLNYRRSIPSPMDDIHTNAYVRYFLKSEKRNFTLMAIPTMYAVSRGKREYAGESYSTLYIKDHSVRHVVRHLNIGTIPNHKIAMETVMKYLMPDIYNVTILDNQLLSPFNSSNIKLYRYVVTRLTTDRAEIVFRPKRHNTQLISGSAIVDRITGRIVKIDFNGEYDMMNFNITAVMGRDGLRSLLPKTCNIEATFHFIGNKISSSFYSVYDNPIFLPDSIVNSHDKNLMDEVRPDPLPDKIRNVYNSMDVIKEKEDTIKEDNEDSFWKKVFWNSFGDYVVNRTKGSFGTNDKGAFRISPILNPFYLGYSGQRGITYKFELNGSYKFTRNKDLTLRFNAGYSFKQNQLYFNIPIRFNYNKRRNGFIGVEIGNGNRITNSNIVEQVKNEILDSIDWDKMNLDYFKDFYVKFVTNYDLSHKWSIQPAFVFHCRSAVDKTGFDLAGRPVSYYSFAPSLQLQYRPLGWNGPIITTDYERGIHVGKADMEYERFELDFSWKKQLRTLRSLSLRFGGGFYTSRSHNSYFLDYVNFREKNIPGGWNDDWTCEFQLLNSNWYNASEYYVRTNITYESPLMFLSRIPFVGRLMEMERIYTNVLVVEHLYPYIEYGYGFTNRFFSMGVFLATRNVDFAGIGCRFSFELFKDW